MNSTAAPGDATSAAIGNRTIGLEAESALHVLRASDNPWIGIQYTLVDSIVSTRHYTNQSTGELHLIAYRGVQSHHKLIKVNCLQ
jgi:hypothetical protein